MHQLTHLWAAVAGGICMERILACKQAEDRSGDHPLLSHQIKRCSPVWGQSEQQAEETAEVVSKGPS